MSVFLFYTHFASSFVIFLSLLVPLPLHAPTLYLLSTLPPPPHLLAVLTDSVQTFLQESSVVVLLHHLASASGSASILSDDAVISCLGDWRSLCVLFLRFLRLPVHYSLLAYTRISSTPLPYTLPSSSIKCTCLVPFTRYSLNFLSSYHFVACTAAVRVGLTSLAIRITSFSFHLSRVVQNAYIDLHLSISPPLVQSDLR